MSMHYDKIVILGVLEVLFLFRISNNNTDNSINNNNNNNRDLKLVQKSVALRWNKPKS